VGAAVRQRAGLVSDTEDLDDLLDGLDPTVRPTRDPGGIVRSHHGALRRVALPDRWLEDPDEDVHLEAAAEALVSGG
jgi:hypothetical protein